MTAILAIKTDTGIVVAADTQETSGDEVRYKFKLSKFGDVIIGSTDTASIQDIIEEMFEDLNYKSAFDGSKSSVRELARAVYSTLGKLRETHAIDQSIPLLGDILVASRNGIFVAEPYGSMYEAPQYVALGAGADLVKGSIVTSFAIYPPEDLDLENLKSVAQLAIDIACQHNVYCGGEVQIEVISNEVEKKKPTKKR